MEVGAVIAANVNICDVEQGIQVGGWIGIVRTPGGHQTVIVSDTVGKGPVHVGA